MQNYPVYEVVVGVYPPTGATVYVVQQGQPTGPPGQYQWTPAQPLPGVVNFSTQAGYPYAFVVGVAAGNYSTAALAKAAANAYCTSQAAARDAAATQTNFNTGDATQALTGATVELGPL